MIGRIKKSTILIIREEEDRVMEDKIAVWMIVNLLTKAVIIPKKINLDLIMTG